MLMMKLKYQTAIATLIQFIVLSFLGILNALNSMVATCRHDSPNCLSNILVSLVFFVLTAAWFGAIWMLGYMAQENRNKRLAQLLIMVEVFVGLIALFNAKHHTDALGLTTSIIDLMLAIWVISLAIRLIRMGSRRNTNSRARVKVKARVKKS